MPLRGKIRKPRHGTLAMIGPKIEIVRVPKRYASPPFISVIIPTFERQLSLIQCLTDLAACLRKEEIEVVVVDQTPPDAWLSIDSNIVSAFGSFSRVFLPTPSLSGARNLGGKIAQGLVLCFLDDDVRVKPTYLVELQSIFETREADIVGGYCVEKFYEISTSQVSMRTVKWLGGTNTALRRTHFMSVGGYDENMPRYNEDAEFCHRLRLSGLHLGLSTRLQVVHRNEPSGGIRHYVSPFQTAQTVLRSNLYFTRVTGGGAKGMLLCALRTMVAEIRGRGRITKTPLFARLIASCAALPGAVVYAFRSPQLISDANIQSAGRDQRLAS